MNTTCCTNIMTLLVGSTWAHTEVTTSCLVVDDCPYSTEDREGGMIAIIVS